MSSRNLLILTCVVATQLAAARVAFADAASQETIGTLEEVLVTAQKRAQSIQDVPISISAFSGEYLEEAGAGTIEDVARMTPNFAIASGSQQTNNIISIRGIGSVGNSAIESSVGVYIDGVYYPRAGSVIGQLSDIESIEILRGPQGTLFGRNTPVGAINITTRNPTHRNSVRLEAGYGAYNAFELGGIINGELSDTTAGRFAIKYLDREGYGFNMLDNQRYGARSDLVLRGKLLFGFYDNLSALLTTDYARINTGGGAIEVLNATVNPAYDARLTSLYGSTATTADPYDWRINQTHRDRMLDEQGGAAIDVKYDFGNGVQLRSISAYRRWQADVFESAIRIPADVLPRFTLFDTRTISQEFQLLSASGRTFEWLAGSFWYREDYDINQGFDAGDSFCVPTVESLRGTGQAQDCLANPQERIVVSDFNQDLDSVALFGQGTWHISDSLASTLGARWNKDRKTADFIQVLNNPYAALVRAAEIDQGMHRNDADTTWFANLSWLLNRDVMLFATASSGYKSGGFNSDGANEALGNERRTFGPETSINYELGVKSTLLDQRMTANVTAYRTDLSNFQDRAFDGISFTVLNVGKVRQQGIEADLRWRPVDPLRVVAGVSYLDSRYLSFPAAPALPGSSTPQDLTGARKTNSPRWRISTDADWTLQLLGGLEWFIGASWQYVDDQNIGLVSNNNPQSVQRAYALVNARTGLRAASDRWDLTVSGNNLADAGYCLTMGDQPLGGTLGAIDAANHSHVQRCIVGIPRTWSIRLGWKY